MCTFQYFCFYQQFKRLLGNTETGKSTLHHSYITGSPFGKSVVFVKGEYSEDTTARITSRDAVLLECEVNVRGILLDVDDVEIEKRILSFANSPNLTVMVLRKTVLSAATEKLTGMSLNEILNRKDLTEYEIGIALTPVLKSLGLK